MRSGMFPKLAVTNLVKNRRIYVPYLLTCICTIAMFYIMEFLAWHPALGQIAGGGDIRMILNLGVLVIMIFSAIFLIYSNSFLMKRRKRELGLYNVLGMEKKHIGRILLWEQLYTVILGFAGGLGLGILGSKLMLVCLMKLLRFSIPFGFAISWEGVRYTFVVFGLIFLFMLFLNIRQIHMVNPIELLQGSSAGEREPKAKWIMAVLGFLCMGSGYYIAVTTESPLEAILLFFVAVVLVMAGTYLLFTAGSIVVLKFLRWKKSFYYKTNHFISVSGMLYRMKQNAVGLASICILSTGVLLMISSTICLYLGNDEMTEARFPREICVTLWETNQEQENAFIEEVEQLAADEQVEISDLFYYQSLGITCVRENGELKFQKPGDSLTKKNILVTLCLLNQEEYNRLTGAELALSDEELLLYRDEEASKDTKLTIQGEDYRVTPLESFPVTEVYYGVSGMYYAVVNDRVFAHLDEQQRAAYENSYSITTASVSIEPVLATDEEKLQFTDQVQELLSDFCHRSENQAVSGFAQGKTETSSTFYMTYGSLFFLGMFLGSLFLMGTALIIYYKQVSEGYEDQKRYEIMQKVGLSRREVKGSIRSQIIMVFFLPLLMAMVHIGFAFPLIRRLLSLFYLTNLKLFALCTLGTIGVFALVYGIIYLLTAKTYYKIVKTP